MHPPLTGLVAAVPTPLTSDGELNLAAVPQLAQHLVASGISAVFVCGSTGECHSLSLAERLRLLDCWSEVLQDLPLRWVAHVGGNCLPDSIQLAAAAQARGADAIAALSPSYFKPADLEDLIQTLAPIARAADETPFFFYDIPILTGVRLSMPAFLQQAPAAIPNLAGLKFTNDDMTALQHCLRQDAGRWQILWGIDEALLAAWSLGVSGAVGSSYNVTGPIFLQMIQAFQQGDWPQAGDHQYRAVQWIGQLADYGYLAALKFCLECLGIPAGPVRPPLRNLTADEKSRLKSELERAGYLDVE